MYALKLNDLNITWFTPSKCGDFVFLQFLEDGRLCEESPVKREYAIATWENMLHDGWERIK